MSLRSNAENRRIETEAIDWVARRDAGLDAAGQRELDVWRTADERHAAALARFDSAWTALDRPRSAGTTDRMLQGLARASRRRRQVRLVWAGGVTACVLALGGWWQFQKSPTLVAASAVASVPTEQKLPDGSIVEFNRGAEIAVDFQPGVRRVRLVRGEAHFQVAHNPARPFIVSAGQVEVKAVGTAFAVRFGQQDVEVLVTEGRVNVADSAQAKPEVATAFVAVGQRISVPLATGLVPATTTEMTQQDYSQGLGWRSTLLDFSGTPLAEAIRQFNTHNRVHLVVEDSRVASLEVSGLFRADNVDGFVRLLETSFSLQAERRSDREIILRGEK